MNEKKKKTILMMMDISLCFHISYFVIILIVSFLPLPKFIQKICGYYMSDIFMINWTQGIGSVITFLLFLLFYLLCRKKIKMDSQSPLVLGILVIICEFYLLFILPFLKNLIEMYVVKKRGAVYIAYLATSRNLASLFGFLLYISMFLLLNAYSVYWIDVRTRQ